MSTWIYLGVDFFNLDDFCHIWVQEDVNKQFYAIGQWRHNNEEVVISRSYIHKETIQEVIFTKKRFKTF